MARHSLLETVLTHLVVALGVLLTSATLAAGPLGGNPEVGKEFPAAVGQTDPAVPSPGESEVAAALFDRDESLVSSRGGRSTVLPSTGQPAGASHVPAPLASSTTAPTWTPAATAVSASSSPSALATGSPATPTGTATRAPTTAPATATRVPATATAAPTRVPATPTSVPGPTPPPAIARAAPTTSPTLPDLSRFRVGIQAGHWKNSELPAELASLRGSTGAAGNGWKEVDVTLAVANRVVAILKGAGVQVDLIPATVPIAYKADAFVAIHGDANSNPSASGYKLARARWSRIPQKDDSLLQAISAEYRSATGLRDHPGSITENMRQYYAFDFLDLKHAVAPTTPSVILELGFLTTASDRKLLLDQPDKAAQGVARGIIRFLIGR